MSDINTHFGRSNTC